MLKRSKQTDYLWMRGRDLLSFECLFLLFLLAGAYKSSSLFESFNEQYDLTATTAIASMLAAVLLFIRRGNVSYYQLHYAGIFLAYAGIVVASYTLSGVRNEIANMKVLKFITFNAWAFCAPLFFIRNSARIERFLRLLFASTVFLGTDAVIRSNAMGMQRFVGSFGSESYHHLGVTSAIGLAMVATGVLFENRLFHRFAIGVITATLATSIMLAGTRQAMAGLIVVVIYLAYSFSTSRRIQKFFFHYLSAAIVLVICFVAVRSFVFSQVDTTWGSERISQSFIDGSGDALHNSMRPQLWAAGLDVWKQHWVWGAGFGAFSEASEYSEFRHPHNLFVELLCELGLVGLMVGTIFWYQPFREILRKGTNPVALTLGAIWVHLFTCALVSGDITDNRQLFAFAALILSCKASQRQRQPSLEHRSSRLEGRGVRRPHEPLDRRTLSGTP